MSIHNILKIARDYYICIRESLCITSQSIIEIGRGGKMMDIMFIK